MLQYEHPDYSYQYFIDMFFDSSVLGDTSMTDLIVQSIPLEDLVHACMQETRRFQRDEASDQKFCLEIFRRALQHNHHQERFSEHAITYADDQARSTLVEIYSEYIHAQINRSAIHPSIVDEVVQDVWHNFWQAANRGLVFDHLPSALAYLRQVVVSVVIKYRRDRQQHAQHESIQALYALTGQELPSGDSDPFETHAQARFRERCREILNSDQHQIVWMRYRLGYKPQEIARRLNQHTNNQVYTARRVSDMLEQSFRRLSEDQEIRDLLQGD